MSRDAAWRAMRFDAPRSSRSVAVRMRMGVGGRSRLGRQGMETGMAWEWDRNGKIRPGLKRVTN